MFDEPGEKEVEGLSDDTPEDDSNYPPDQPSVGDEILIPSDDEEVDEVTETINKVGEFDDMSETWAVITENGERRVYWDTDVWVHTEE